MSKRKKILLISIGALIVTVVTLICIYNAPKAIYINVLDSVPSEQLVSAEIPEGRYVNTVNNSIPNVGSITNETFIVYPTIKLGSLPIEYGNPVLYNFKKHMCAGVTLNDSVIYGEANYGIQTHVSEKGNILIRTYNNTEDEISLKTIHLESLDRHNGSYQKMKNITEKYKILNPEQFNNGLYRFTAVFSTQKTINLYFYVNNHSVFFCEILPNDKLDYAMNRRFTLMKTFRTLNVSPASSLDWESINYPCTGIVSKYRRDTNKWSKLSKSITKSHWSDEHKVSAFCDWISENIAYDYYQVNMIGVSRAKHNDDFTGTYSAYDTRVGTDIDMAHILLIMCRANDIPAVIIDSINNKHAWTAVYIDNRWYEFDMSLTSNYMISDSNIENRNKNKDCDTSVWFTVFPTSNSDDLTIPEDLGVNNYLQTGATTY